jgi:CMP-N,N'-diacetyllegionaminic acid synthase
VDSASKPNVLATICARGGSKGVPRKNTRSILGISLIVRAIECARACDSIDQIIVSTDDDEIAAIAEQAGLDVPFRRPTELATDAAPKITTIAHAVEWIETHSMFRPDIIVDLDIGVPTRLPEDITKCVDKLWQGDLDATVTIYESERNPYFNMVEKRGDRIELVVPPAPGAAGFTGRQLAPPTYSVSPSVFAWRRDATWVTHLYEGRWGGNLVPRERAIDIDIELDFKLAEIVLASDDRYRSGN